MSKVLVFIFSLSLLACSKSHESSLNDEWIDDPNSQNIFGGELVSPNDELGRSVVAIVSAGAGLCSGVLIHNKVVLTAAHCLPKKGSPIKVVFGTTVSKTAESRKVRNFVIHPKFKTNRKKDWNDIAIVFLEEAAPNGLQPAVLNNGELKIEAGAVTQSLGFGINRIAPGLKDSQRGAGLLRQVGLQILNPDFSKTEFTLNQGPSKGGICQGDSGGPVFLEMESGMGLIGIISRTNGAFGFSCIIDSIVTRVDTYSVWIQQTLQSHKVGPL
ncbi:MAG: S1 family peptidase [Pseudobdellovibrionaceae bacterium]